MSSIGTSIFGLLSGVTDCGTNVFPVERPQKTELPALTYSIISTIPVKQQTTTANLQQVRIQISIFAISYSQCETIASQVRDVLDQSGYWNYDASGLTIQTSTFDSEIDTFIQNADFDGIYAKYQDYILFINR